MAEEKEGIDDRPCGLWGNKGFAPVGGRWLTGARVRFPAVYACVFPFFSLWFCFFCLSSYLWFYLNCVRWVSAVFLWGGACPPCVLLILRLCGQSSLPACRLFFWQSWSWCARSMSNVFVPAKLPRTCGYECVLGCHMYGYILLPRFSYVFSLLTRHGYSFVHSDHAVIHPLCRTPL